MSQNAKLQKEATAILKDTSRTFFIPISFLDGRLKSTVASAYLCMRAIDEIEDHPEIPSDAKQRMLRETARLLAAPSFDEPAYIQLIKPYDQLLPPVTLRLGDWIRLCPEGIALQVKQSTAEMAEGMAKWAEKGWNIQTKEDLDDYTYYVAGLVGSMLSDIWRWHDGTETDRQLAIGFGRGLQAVNVLRNVDEDAERGVSFIPDGWSRQDLFEYARKNLAQADKYVISIKNRRIVLFCKLPLKLAHSTLKSLEAGKEKMTRSEVEAVVKEVQQET
ncbi:squalene/phytoene synthase family protein [Planococcus lenghuensis]|uniref:Phytoene/squalene synthase family protein n=1 Tax=Planococcus lenghuensis TaxID=2213202 RepID=A0A1Q2KWD7_9BACL|nr:phytoene/squalene synthase family protein [Planococcus lenghuensis]AQQ52117.1 phytoene/squalene synthase family protein [Planococcus lenghuensis]